MIHVRVDRHHPSSVDIYVNISDQSSMRTSSPDSNIYDRLFDHQTYSSSRQSTIVKTRSDSNPSISRKNYTLQQILDNVESIQGQYEQVVKNRKTRSTVTCLSSLKQLSRMMKNLRNAKASTEQTSTSCKSNPSIDSKSPFTFGGETLQWIALPQDHCEHIYENAFLT